MALNPAGVCSPEKGAGGDPPGVSHAAVKVSAATSMPT